MRPEPLPPARKCKETKDKTPHEWHTWIGPEGLVWRCRGYR